MELRAKKAIADAHGISLARVGQLCKKGAVLIDAVVDDKVDILHPAYLGWAANRNQEAMSGTTVGMVADTAVMSAADDGSAGAMLDIMDLKLRDVVDRYGTEIRFQEWLKAVKLIEDVREKRLKNYTTERSLISRELVTTHIFGLLEEVSRRLLADGAKTITRRTYAAAKSGVSLEDMEAENRGIISQNLKKARDQITRALRKK